MLDATRLRVLVAVARYGSVTAAAQALNYAQPSISHHMARLEAETGAKLIERSGRGIRLTEAGRLLAERAEEILGRLDAAEAELAAHVGLRQDRVRLVAFGAALATMGAAAATAMAAERAATDIQLTQADPARALHMLRAGEADVAVVFRPMPDDSQPDLRYRELLDDPFYLLRPEGQDAAAGLTELAGQRWICGGGPHRDAVTALCRSAGFVPEIAVSADDYVAVQALVAARVGVSILPGLELRASRHPKVEATELAGARRQVLAVSYGEPPDPPATAQLIEALVRSAESIGRAGVL